jgi:hypothetical protein
MGAGEWERVVTLDCPQLQQGAGARRRWNGRMSMGATGTLAPVHL